MVCNKNQPGRVFLQLFITSVAGATQASIQKREAIQTVDRMTYDIKRNTISKMDP